MLRYFVKGDLAIPLPSFQATAFTKLCYTVDISQAKFARRASGSCQRIKPFFPLSMQS
jgi:hypothetical protein